MFHAALMLALAMAPGDYSSLKSQVESEGFSSDQLAAIASAAKHNTFTSAQVKGLLGELSFSKDQLKALQTMAPKIEGKVDVEGIVGVFDFSSDQKKAREILSTVKSAPAASSGSGRPSAPAATTVANHCPTKAELPALQVTYTGTWKRADVDALVAKLTDTGFSSDRLDVLKAALDGQPRALKANQVARILETFGFNKDMASAVELMDDHILGLTATELKGILGQFDFSKDRLQALTALRDTMTDPEHAHILLDAFDMSSDKQKARAILDDIRPRSHLFGTVGARSAVFVVDVSGSMSAKVRTNQGTQLTRLEFVQCQLARVLEDQLSPSAQFGLVVFSNNARKFGGGLVQANPGAVRKASMWMQNQPAAGKTNIQAGLNAAFSMNPDVVYLLTDGTPTAGQVTNPGQLAQLAKNKSAGRVPVHSVAFTMGQHAGDDKAASQALMLDIATQTGGIYRAVSQ